MGAFLVVQRGGEIGRRVELPPQLTLGCAPDNDLPLDDPRASRYQAVLKGDGAGWAATDLGAEHPTMVNDRTLEPGVPHPLTDGDVLRVGGAALAFVCRAPAATAVAGESPTGRLSLARWRAMVERGRTAELPPR